MKLYVKQKVFSLNEKFTVKNERGDDVFFVEGQFLSIPKQFQIYDSFNNHVASIKKKLLTFMPHMLISTAEHFGNSEGFHIAQPALHHSRYRMGYPWRFHFT